MSSVNISLNDKAYQRLVRLKRKEESFSQVVVRITEEKNIEQCYGLLKDVDDKDWKIVEAEMERVRHAPWRMDKI
jgi:predicted CopG family antitoxin